MSSFIEQWLTDTGCQCVDENGDAIDCFEDCTNDCDPCMIQIEYMAMKAECKRLREVLEILARLGNAPMLGNSDGNIIAQEALAAKEKSE